MPVVFFPLIFSAQLGICDVEACRNRGNCMSQKTQIHTSGVDRGGYLSVSSISERHARVLDNQRPALHV